MNFTVCFLNVINSWWPNSWKACLDCLLCESSNPKGWPNLTQRCKRFATASTSTQVAVLPWRYDEKMGTANLLHASA